VNEAEREQASPGTVLARASVGLEQGADGHFHAHSLGLAAPANWGRTPAEAIGLFQRDYLRWLAFLAARGHPVPAEGEEIEVAVDEWIETDARVERGETHALFAADLAALTPAEAAHGLRLLGDLRGRILSPLRALSRREADAALERPAEGGWTVRQVLEELARAQWQLLSRLGATPLGESPDATLARLDTAMALVVQQLGELPPERRGTRLELEGEEWTPRKVLRRLLWLEWSLGGVAARALSPGGNQG
jgi:hypothetical protein